MAKLMRVADLTPHPILGGNEVLPPLSDEEFAALKASIESDNVQSPILVAMPERVILDGHHRWRAAKELEMVEVPVVLEESRSERERVKLGLTLNAVRRQLSVEGKRPAVAVLIKADPTQSDRGIAAALGASHWLVGEVRAELVASGQVEAASTREGVDGKKQKRHRSGTTAPRLTRAERKKSKAERMREQREEEYEERTTKRRSFIDEPSEEGAVSSVVEPWPFKPHDGGSIPSTAHEEEPSEVEAPVSESSGTAGAVGLPASDGSVAPRWMVGGRYGNLFTEIVTTDGRRVMVATHVRTEGKPHEAEYDFAPDGEVFLAWVLDALNAYESASRLPASGAARTA